MRGGWRSQPPFLYEEELLLSIRSVLDVLIESVESLEEKEPPTPKRTKVWH